VIAGFLSNLEWCFNVAIKGVQFTGEINCSIGGSFYE
tara:strand:+ start:659 stop:769 length:111 start_codon:yes stop_codon:yes gene_type:complete